MISGTPPLSPALTVDKQVSPADTTTVAAGDGLTYTITLGNSAGTADATVAVTDDLSGAVDDATLDAQSLTVSSDSVVGAFSGTTLRVNGTVPAGQTVTVTYKVTVKADGQRGDSQVTNCVSPAPGRDSPLCTTNPVQDSPTNPPTPTPTPTPAPVVSPTVGPTADAGGGLAPSAPGWLPAVALLLVMSGIAVAGLIRRRHTV